jgi:YVTN family beta-propeller protein
VGGVDQVTVIDGATDRKIASIPVVGPVTSMLWVSGENKIFCAHYTDARLTVIDAASHSVITSLSVGINPISLAYNPINNQVYCANKHSRDIDVIDASINTGLTVMAFPDEPFDIIYVGNGGGSLLDNTILCAGGEYFSWFYCNINQPGQQIHQSGSDFSAVALNTTDHKVYIADRAQDRIFGPPNHPLVGDEPVALLWNETGDKIYCANFASDNISVIDGVTDNVIAIIPAGDGPVGLCWNSVENKVYCLNAESDDITIIDGVTDAIITTVPAKGIYPYPTYNPYYGSTIVKPQLVFNSQNNKLYFPQQYNCEVRIIDGNSNNIIGDVRLGTPPWSLTWNATSDKLYSINRPEPWYFEGSITIIDAVSLQPLSTLTMGNWPSAVAWNSTNNTVFCASAISNDVRVVDGVTDQVTDTIGVGNRPVDVLWNPTGNKIYTANEYDNSVSVIDGSTHALLNTVPTGNNPRKLTWNGINNKIYVANYESGTATVIDGFSNSATATIAVGAYPQNLVWNETNNKVYCSGSTLSIIDGLMDTVITFQLPNIHSYRLAWNETDNKVYCANIVSDIFVIDGESNQVADTIRLGGEQVIVDQFWNRADNRLYCHTWEEVQYFPSTQYIRKLFVIDGSSDSVLTSLTLDELKYWSSTFEIDRRQFFACDPQRNRIFLGNTSNSWISVIDPTVTGIGSEPLAEVPEKFILKQNYPNPFNPSTVIS